MTARSESPLVAAPGTVFRALVWKELREGAVTALIALGIVAAGLYFSTVVFAATGSVGLVTSPISVSLFTLTSAGAALIIGYRQVARDDRGDMWALLTHRPATRSQIFWGKSAAAALSYVAATAIPLAIAVAWQATPGHIPAPFDIRITSPDVIDLLAGFVYLFAAMLGTVRAARWYASRLLPFGLALACSTMTIAVDRFAVALGVIVLATTVIATAARGAFVAGGSYAGQTRASRVALALALSFGLQIVGGVALGIVGTALSLRSPEARSYRTSEVIVTRDGTLARVVSQIRLFDARAQVDRVSDLSGRTIPGFEGSLAGDTTLTAGVISAAAVPLNVGGWYGRFGRRRGYRALDDLFVPLVPTPFNADVGRTSWYFIQRLGLVAGYDNASARQVGWLGPDGFSPAAARPTSRFQGSLRPYSEFTYNQPLITMPSAVYRLDLVGRRVRKIFSAPVGEEVLGAAGSGDSAATTVRGARAQFDVVATSDSVYVQARDGRRELVVPRDPRAAGYGSVTVTRALAAPGEPTFVWYKPASGTLPGPTLDTASDQIAEFGVSGALIARAIVASDSGPRLVVRPEWAQIAGVGLLTPLASRAGLALWARLNALPRTTAAEPLGARIVGWSAVVAGALLSAILVLIVGRRYAFDNRKMLVWLPIAVAFGVLGLLLMASLLDWPARERCPACGHDRVVTLDRCDRCGAPFAPPPRDGTEIFGAAWSGASEATSHLAI